MVDGEQRFAHGDRGAAAERRKGGDTATFSRGRTERVAGAPEHAGISKRLRRDWAGNPAPSRRIRPKGITGKINTSQAQPAFAAILFSPTHPSQPDTQRLELVVGDDVDDADPPLTNSHGMALCAAPRRSYGYRF